MVEAVMYYDEVLARRERLLGPAKSDAARVLNNIGRELLAGGFLDAAEERHRQALARLEAVYGPTACTVGAALLGLGEVALARNERLVATAHAERTLSLCEEVGGRFAPQLVAQAEFLLARVAWADPALRVHARPMAKRRP
jgi:Tetratricopeptide repeat